MKRFSVPVLLFVLAACSQSPADLAAPALEAQFGTPDRDFGGGVAAPAGRVYALSEQEGEVHNPSTEENVTFENAHLRRYDGSGTLAWSRRLASVSCNEWDAFCPSLEARALAADAGGNAYALVLAAYGGVQDCAAVTYYRVHKYGAAGNLVRAVDLGENGTGFLGNSGPAYTSASDLAADGGGNLYVVRQTAAFSEDYCEAARTNVVAKYSSTGSLVWQRTSPVGTLHGVSVSSTGHVYVAGSIGLAKYTGSGTLLWTKAGAAEDVAAVGTDTVYARTLTAVRKLDASGRQLWSRAQTGLSGMVVADMTTDGGANVYLTGKYNASSTNRDVFTRKLAAGSGNTVFTKTFGTPAYDDARGIATLTGNEVYLTGATKGALAHPFRGGDTDGYVRKLSSSGNPVWTR